MSKMVLSSVLSVRTSTLLSPVEKLESLAAPQNIEGQFNTQARTLLAWYNITTSPRINARICALIYFVSLDIRSHVNVQDLRL